MRGCKGVTLVEVLIVMLIVSVLAGIVFVASGPARESSRQGVCISQLKQIYQAVQMYSADYQSPEQIPGLGDLSLINGTYALNEYLKGGKELLFCPNSTPPMRRKFASTYAWTIAMSPALASPKHPAHGQYIELLDRINRLGSATPIVSCNIHDETFYAPRDGRTAPNTVGRFQIHLRLDGSVWKGWENEIRVDTFTRNSK